MFHKRHLKELSLAVCAVLMVFGAFGSMLPAQAFWPFSRKAKVISAPVMPPETAIADECDPIKANIQREFSRSFLIRPVMRPYRAWLVHRHHECLGRVHRQIYSSLDAQGNE